ncbi:MAG: hypothetical protein QG629_460 [Patescibacteria group bacterium]|nr:hypothetical protein [Candidatus Saccharibacteria bacterium]MDQ5963378.1 hypothetical protein [Patescibacteria group bacterium]
MFKGGWTVAREREFGPRRWAYITRGYKKRDFAADHPFESSRGVYGDVQTELRNTVQKTRGRWRQYQDVGYLRPIAAAATTEAIATNDAKVWLRALVLRAPRAAQAQRQMDKHPHGFRGKEERTLELIDFNDAFVSTVLCLPKDELGKFADEARLLMDWFCKRVGVAGFSNLQYDGIVRGLSREIAVYHGAKEQGLTAELTGRHADAMGIDVIVSDPASKKYINIDCKTPSAYRHRLGDLVFDGRKTETELLEADTLGYSIEINGHDSEKVEVVLLRIDPEKFGDVQNFEFARPDELGSALRYLIEHFGQEATLRT